ncbi:hypothetical protein [Bacillus cereus]|nr:hypothetical protein [Bacillus cereus]
MLEGIDWQKFINQKELKKKLNFNNQNKAIQIDEMMKGFETIF